MLIIISLMWKRKHCPFKERCYKYGARTKTYNVTIKKNIHINHIDYMETEESQEMILQILIKFMTMRY